MADDRYGWLDEETAERLLRRLPVDAPDTGTPGSVRQPGHPTGEQPDMVGESGGEGAGKSPKSGKDRKECGALDVPSDAWFRDADRRAAAKLAAVLDELAAEYAAPRAPARGATAVELPGEAAALDAFRAARFGVLPGEAVGVGGPDSDSVSASGSVPGPASASAAGSGHPAESGFVPEGPSPGAGRGAGDDRRARGDTGRGRGGHFGRRARYVLVGGPLRAGFAIALAGCALGGVAVAAGTGVLPTPFSGDTAPAVTMSPAASPEGDRSANEAAGGAGDGTEDTAGGKHRHHKSPGDEKRTRGPGDPEDSRDLANSGGGGKKHGRDGGEQDDGRSKHGKGDKGGKNGRYGEKPGSGRGSESHKKAVAAALCKAYTDGKLEAGQRRELERAAGGRAVVRKFCGRYGKPGGGGESGEQSGGGSGGPHVPGTSGGSDSGGSDDGGDGGSGTPGHGGGSNGGDAGGTAGAPSAPAETGAPGAANGASGK